MIAVDLRESPPSLVIPSLGSRQRHEMVSSMQSLSAEDDCLGHTRWPPDEWPKKGLTVPSRRLTMS